MHGDQHLLVHCGHPGLAVPEDAELGLFQEPADLQHPHPVCGEGVIAKGEIDQTVAVPQLAQLIDHRARRAEANPFAPEKRRGAEEATGGAAARGDDELQLAPVIDPDAVSGAGAGHRQGIQVLDRRARGAAQHLGTLAIGDPGDPGEAPSGRERLQKLLECLLTLAEHDRIERRIVGQHLPIGVGGVGPAQDDEAARIKLFGESREFQRVDAVVGELRDADHRWAQLLHSFAYLVPAEAREVRQGRLVSQVAQQRVEAEQPHRQQRGERIPGPLGM